MEPDWGRLLVGQLEFYWDMHLWPRLGGLTDEEYFWEPADRCWSVRLGTDGRYVMDAVPEPPSFTTIAWRMAHLSATCLANRARTFFDAGSVPDGADMNDPRLVPTGLPGTAVDGIAFLEEAYRSWHGGIAALDGAALRAPLGRMGGWFADEPMAALIVHINREVMHHGGEICLLRDLYLATGATSRHSRLVPRP
ncbi:MAG: hypothetical protein AUI14_25270 [Actinobacteria bacterium 13_2_20CM_2_71_6]|nr:MAG: hypothetical protein AUI14_25270 [Actinobacteria bacterium 13_2_20CM_2_71_6]